MQPHTVLMGCVMGFESQLFFIFENQQLTRVTGGSCEIRTHGGFNPSPVFKTGALNRSAKLPMA
jgi:hypothetical protein